jgi:hypothetical protein
VHRSDNQQHHSLADLQHFTFILINLRQLQDRRWQFSPLADFTIIYKNSVVVEQSEAGCKKTLALSFLFKVRKHWLCF